ncbi:hypothetical protein K5I04_05780 [Murdochiella sp. Marseille-P8839]|nr:hypothetical protein [Murdochiella sp. Marseille-P8839]
MSKKKRMATTGLLLGAILFCACTAPNGEGKTSDEVENSSVVNALSSEVAKQGSASGTEENRAESKPIGENLSEDVPRMVQIDGKCYRDTGFVNSGVTCGTADGKIMTSVGTKEKPTKDGESNFGTGMEYQRWNETAVSVKENDKWILFVDEKVEVTSIPDGVATFTAKVREAEVLPDTDEIRLLVDVSEVPEHFMHLQKTLSPAGKPIAVFIGKKTLFYRNDEPIPFDRIQGKSADEWKGQSVQIWFDGTVTHDDPEMSYPTALGTVYGLGFSDR